VFKIGSLRTYRVVRDGNFENQAGASEGSKVLLLKSLKVTFSKH